MAKIFSKTTVVDEVLGEDARYNILEDGGAAFKADMQINLASAVSVAGTNVNAALLNPLETAVDTLDDMLVTYTTGGTDTAFTLTTPQASALATHERWRVAFNATAGATPTINRDAKGAKALKYYDANGAKQACGATTIISGMITDIVYDGTDYVLLDSLPPAGGTIADNSLALAKLVNATARYNLIGRSTAGAGAWEEKATSADVFAMLGAANDAAIMTALGLTANGQSLVTAADYAAMLTLLFGVAMPENTAIQLDTALSADGKYSGIVEAGTAGAALAFGDLIYLAVADSRWELADADAEATAGPVQLGICVLAAAGDGSATMILRYGKVRADAVFPTLTVGAPAYVGTTAGDIQAAAPSGAADIVRIVGHGCTGDELFFCPDSTYIELA